MCYMLTYTDLGETIDVCYRCMYVVGLKLVNVQQNVIQTQGLMVHISPFDRDPIAHNYTTPNKKKEKRFFHQNPFGHEKYHPHLFHVQM